MRQFCISGFLFMAIAAVAQPKVTFNEMTHDFGEILWKQPAQVSYVINNEGSGPLVISNVTTSCGCTVAEWTPGPIEAGQSGIVTVTFDAKMLGRFYKTIGIYCNAAPRPIYLELLGDVKEHIDEAAPGEPEVEAPSVTHVTPEVQPEPAAPQKVRKKFRASFPLLKKKKKTND